MEYKLLGASIRQIAEKLSMSSTRVHEIITEELAKETESAACGGRLPAVASQPA